MATKGEGAPGGGGSRGPGVVRYDDPAGQGEAPPVPDRDRPDPAAIRRALKEHLLALLRDDPDVAAALGRVLEEARVVRVDDLRPDALRGSAVQRYFPRG